MIIAAFVFFFYLAYLAVQGLTPTILRPSPASDMGKVFAGQFMNYSHAALTFASNNQGYTGTISPTQLAPYLGNYSIPAGATAQINGGFLQVWADPPGLTYPQERWAVDTMDNTGGDLAYSIDNSGTLYSPSVGDEGPAPAGCPSGAAVYQIATPHN